MVLDRPWLLAAAAKKSRSVLTKDRVDEPKTSERVVPSDKVYGMDGAEEGDCDEIC